MFNSLIADTTSDKPVYQQIADYIRKMIHDGVLMHGDKLPSQRELSKKFKVSRPTISKVLEILEFERLIIIEPRSRGKVQLSSNNTPVKWEKYVSVCTSGFSTNVALIRGNENILDLQECYFGDTFHPQEPLKKVMSNVQKKMDFIYHHRNFDIRGTQSLRQGLCSYLSKSGINVSPSQVLVCNNLRNAYKILIETLGSKGTNCYLEEESIFFSNKTFSQYVKMTPVPVDSDGVVVEELVRLVNRRRKGFLMIDTQYAMPTGIVHSLERKKALLNLSHQYSFPIIEIETVRDCWHEEPVTASMKSLDTHNNVIYIFELCRPYMSVSLTAIVAPEAIMPALVDVKLRNDAYNDILSQSFLEELISNNVFSDYMDYIRPDIIKRRDQVEVILKRLFSNMATWEKPRYGVNWRLNFDCNVDKCVKSLSNEGILVYPPSMFGSNKNFIWFCYTGLEIDKLEYALERVAYYINLES